MALPPGPLLRRVFNRAAEGELQDGRWAWSYSSVAVGECYVSELGHRSASTHTAHFGARARQIVRPCTTKFMCKL